MQDIVKIGKALENCKKVTCIRPEPKKEEKRVIIEVDKPLMSHIPNHPTLIKIPPWHKMPEKELPPKPIKELESIVQWGKSIGRAHVNAVYDTEKKISSLTLKDF
jgi:hypothetical protein